MRLKDVLVKPLTECLLKIKRVDKFGSVFLSQEKLKNTVVVSNYNVITSEKKAELWESYKKALKAWNKNKNWIGWKPNPPNE